jgi:maleylpyruvate isomerase
VPPGGWGARIERTPGGRTFVAAEAPTKRLLEVEFHHADLATSYSPADWSPEFAVLLVTAVTALTAPEEGTTGFVAVATDVDRSWTIGDGGPAVSGAASALGWWLGGRGDGTGLTSEGELPRIGAW